MDGYLRAINHWYAPYGSGKTTTALALAWSVALGKRIAAMLASLGLFIATDLDSGR